MSLAAGDGARLVAAALVLAGYAALCGGIAWRERRRRRAARAQERSLARAAADDADGAAPRQPWLVAWASQTGAAEALAWQAANALHGAGWPVRVEALGRLTRADLAAHGRALFIASTAGEGDAPDNAAPFVRRVMELELPTADAAQPALAGLRFAVLALGDREFKHFCAFGHRLDAWLAAAGAQTMFECVEVDALAEAGLQRWHHELGRLASIGDAPAFSARQFEAWRLAARRHLNPGSAGAPVFELELEAAAGAPAPRWESGDLVQVRVAGSTARPREYSIASVPAEGRLRLLVRQERRADGSPGLASGWLSAGAALCDTVELALLAHANFRLGTNADAPLILIGNGTGIAGLRSHLAARALAGRTRNWLIFGERQAAHDFHAGADVRAWQADGMLERVDLAFSRDQPHKVYVQDRLRAQAAALRDWVADGAAIYVCGSLHGMAAGVDQALAEVLGRAELERLVDDGRYRRDVY